MSFLYEKVREKDLPSHHINIIKNFTFYSSSPKVERWVNSEMDCVLYQLRRFAVKSVSLDFLMFLQSKTLHFVVEEEFLSGYTVKYFLRPFEINQPDRLVEQAIEESLKAYCESSIHNQERNIGVSVPNVYFGERYYDYWHRG